MDTVDKIIKLINEKGINEKTFLSDIGLNKSALSDWKKGINSSYLKHIVKIAQYFNVTTDYLLGLTDNPNPIPQPKILTKDQRILEKLKTLAPDKRKAIEILMEIDS